MRTDGLGGLWAGAHNKKPRVMRGSERLTTQLSELAGLFLAGQNIPHHKPAKFSNGKPIEPLGSSTQF